MNQKKFALGLLAIGLLVFVRDMNAQTGVGYFSIAHTNWPALPANIYGLPQYSTGTNGVFLLDDRDFSYEEFGAQRMATMQSESPPIPGDGDYGSETNTTTSSAVSFGPNDLWLEILSVNYTAHTAYLRLHGTVDTDNYQILSKTNLADPGEWRLRDIQIGAFGTNVTDFTSVSIGNNQQMFFRAHHANPIVTIERTQDAIEPTNSISGQDGLFTVNVYSASGNLTVYYRISGSADNGVDYVDAGTQTILSGSVTIPSGQGTASIDIQPLQDSLIEFEETVTLSLIQTNSYLIIPDNDSATITINDNFLTNIFTVVTNLDSPVAIDYHAPSNALVVSYNFDHSGAPCVFALIRADGSVITNWSAVSGLDDEVKLVTIQTGGALTNSAGFTNGDMYFGSGSDVGYLSANGTRSNLTWCTLTNDVVTNVQPLRGSIYLDRTGIWSNQLVAVASDGANNPSDKGVWRIDSSGHPALITQIFTPHLEGVLTLTNDVAKWGPWAGKIITGDEAAFDSDFNLRPLVYSIDTNGTTASYALNIEPEDFDLVPPNQDLYCVHYWGGSSSILKISRTLLTNVVGSVLITQAGEISHPPRLFFVKWDGTNFATRSLGLPYPPFGGAFEHVTFAPVNIPSHEP